METIDIEIRRAHAEDAARLADIYNDALAARSATFETTPRTPADMARRVTEDPRLPVLVAVGFVAPGATPNGETPAVAAPPPARERDVLGWAGISAYRPRACYAGVGEFSIYIDRTARGRGIGKQLLDALVQEAVRLGYWKLLSRVFPFNTASLALCRACGFREVGVYERHAQLDGQWLDVVIVERLLPENQPASLPDAASVASTVSASAGRGERP